MPLAVATFGDLDLILGHSGIKQLNLNLVIFGRFSSDQLQYIMPFGALDCLMPGHSDFEWSSSVESFPFLPPLMILSSRSPSHWHHVGRILPPTPTPPHPTPTLRTLRFHSSFDNLYLVSITFIQRRLRFLMTRACRLCILILCILLCKGFLYCKYWRAMLCQRERLLLLLLLLFVVVVGFFGGLMGGFSFSVGIKKKMYNYFKRCTVPLKGSRIICCW